MWKRTDFRDLLVIAVQRRIWNKVLKKGPSKIKPVNNMKWYGLLKQIISLFKSCFPQLGLFLNNLFHLETPTNVCDIPYSKNTYPLLTINYFYKSFIRDIYRVINTSPMLLIKICSSLSLQIRLNIFYNVHSVKSVCIRSYSGPHFPALGLSPYLWTRITLNMDTFHEVVFYHNSLFAKL